MNIDPTDCEGVTNKLRALLYPEEALQAEINELEEAAKSVIATFERYGPTSAGFVTALAELRAIVNQGDQR